MGLAQRMDRLGTETAITSFVRARALQATGRRVINLTLGAPDRPTPQHIVEAGIRALQDGHHFYTEPKGVPALREAVAADLRRRHGAEVKPGNILVVPGSKPIIFYAVQMLVEPGDEVIVPDPGYPMYESVVRFTGGVPVRLPPREELNFGFAAADLVGLVNARTRMIILNSPANPTGGIVSREFLDEVSRVVMQWPRLYIVSDEIYDQLLFDGHQNTSVLQYEQLRQRVIVSNGWSKTYAMTGWRLGYGVWPDGLIDHAEKMQINFLSCANAAVQMAGIAALQGSQDCVADLVAEFDRRRRFMVRALNDIPGVHCKMPPAGFFVFANVSDTGLDSGTFERRLLDESGVAAVAGTSFGGCGEGFVRISLTRELNELEEAASLIRSFVASLP